MIYEAREAAAATASALFDGGLDETVKKVMKAMKAKKKGMKAKQTKAMKKGMKVKKANQTTAMSKKGMSAKKVGKTKKLQDIIVHTMVVRRTHSL